MLKGDAIKQAFKEVAVLLNNDKSQNIPYNEQVQKKNLTNDTNSSPVPNTNILKSPLPTKTLNTKVSTPTIVPLP